MRLAIMQPYFMPYLGYWQMINAVDKFILLDNVNFIKKGYINRNYILIGGKSSLISLQVAAVGQNKLILDHKLVDDAKWRRKLIQSISIAYKKAPFFADVFQFIEPLIVNNEASLSQYLASQIKGIAEYLKVNTEIVASASQYNTGALKAQDRILEICKINKAAQYINAIGGQNLYSKDNFKAQGIDLSFIKMNEISYPQFKNDFVPNLSIIDVMMFNSVKDISKMLNSFSLT